MGPPLKIARARLKPFKANCGVKGNELKKSPPGHQKPEGVPGAWQKTAPANGAPAIFPYKIRLASSIVKIWGIYGLFEGILEYWPIGFAVFA
jgi:hypothetical protein